MFTHVTVGANDLDASRKFYDAVLGALGHQPGAEGNVPMPGVWYMTPRGMLGVVRPRDGQAACHANGGTIGFFARSPEAVVAFAEAGVAAGGTAIEDPAGPRTTPFGPLHLAALHGLPLLVQRLLRAGADPDVRDALNRSPREIAVMRGFIDVAGEFEPLVPGVSSMARFLRDNG